MLLLSSIILMLTVFSEFSNAAQAPRVRELRTGNGGNTGWRTDDRVVEASLRAFEEEQQQLQKEKELEEAAERIRNSGERPENILNPDDFQGIVLEHPRRFTFVQLAHSLTGLGVDCNAQSVSEETTIWIPVICGRNSKEIELSERQEVIYVKLRNLAIMNRRAEGDYLRFRDDKQSVDLNGKGGEWNVFEVQTHYEKRESGGYDEFFRFRSVVFGTYLYVGRDNQMRQIEPSTNEINEGTLFKLGGAAAEKLLWE